MQNVINNLPDGSKYVLDSYALLAYLKDEPSSDQIGKLFDAAKEGNCHLYLCVANLGEVLYIVERERRQAQDRLTIIDELPIEIVEAGRALTLAASHLKADYPIAYADCFAAALAQVKGALLITGDPEFRKIKPASNLHIEWLA